ncbi:MAG: ABC transporter permease [Anaerolineaceae bacterium]|nr:ABC transporter permease [Anaerolineaceae bacterium]
MQKRSSKQVRHKGTIAKWIPPLSILAGLCIWEMVVRLGNYPAFILPAPSRIAERFVSASKSGVLWPNVWVTFYEVILGLLLGTVCALLAGYFLAHSPMAEKIIFPYVVVSQAVPLAAIAPLLIIWFGSGIRPKIFICALTVFFPLLINILVGYRDLERNLNDLMTSMKAGRWARLVYLEFPGTLPVVLGGLRISATLSVIGAVVGELSGADAGLGYLINIGRGQYDTALVFVALIMLMLIALVLYGTVLLLERRLLKWNK